MEGNEKLFKKSVELLQTRQKRAASVLFRTVSEDLKVLRKKLKEKNPRVLVLVARVAMSD